MKVLLASSEIFPYSKTGGLADMVGALGKYLSDTGIEVAIVTPLYAGIDRKFPLEKMDLPIELPLGSATVAAGIRALKVDRNLTVYFVEQPEIFDRPGLYQEDGVDYPDNCARFTFFSKCVVFLSRALTWKPLIVHAHDWQAGLVPLMIRHRQWREGWKSAPLSCMTVHNLAFQGSFPYADYGLTNLPLDYFHYQGVEFYGQMNCLKAGLVYSDLVTTVSPTYAREITTPEFGCGLEGVLRERGDRLVGILNGVDYAEWNTESNPALPAAYSVKDLSGKAVNKRELQREMGLPLDADVPLFGTVTRLSEQKGLPIQIPALEEMLANTAMQFVLLGSGEKAYQQALLDLALRHPDQVSVKIGYDHQLSHRIEAGCDFYLMPSRFEPCGLNQMYSLRYGTLPIVRATGGLSDSVIDVREDEQRANGIKFHEYSVSALVKAMQKALALYAAPELMAFFRRNAMLANFSWEGTAQQYIALYQELLRRS